jgi:hypothetical protein
VDDSVFNFLVDTADEGDDLPGNSIVSPWGLFVYTVERLLIVYEVGVEREVPL